MQYVYVLLQTKINGRYLLFANLQRNIDITEKLKTVFRKNGLQLIRQKLNYYGHLCLRYSEKIKPLVSFTEKLMHFLIKKFLKWLLPETIVILYQVVNKNIFVFSPFYTYAYLGIILDFLAGFLLLCRSICQLFHYVIPLPNESLSHTLLISYHISSSYLHKKRTFPCASLFIFYCFFSLTFVVIHFQLLPAPLLFPRIHHQD